MAYNIELIDAVFKMVVWLKAKNILDYESERSGYLAFARKRRYI